MVVAVPKILESQNLRKAIILAMAPLLLVALAGGAWSMWTDPSLALAPCLGAVGATLLGLLDRLARDGPNPKPDTAPGIRAYLHQVFTRRRPGPSE
jgi:hypothetical protein